MVDLRSPSKKDIPCPNCEAPARYIERTKKKVVNSPNRASRCEKCDTWLLPVTQAMSAKWTVVPGSAVYEGEYGK